jgi:hypothetical protein
LAYYLPGTTGWGSSSTFGGSPLALWRPLIKTADGALGVGTNAFGFNISWSSGMTVVVEASTNCSAPVWLPLQTNTLAADISYFSDSSRSNYPTRVYRLHWQ